VFSNCKAQQESFQKKSTPHLVHVTSWGKKSIGFSSDFWNDSKKEEIVKQIGKEEYNKVIKNCDYTSTPKQLSGMNNVKNKNEYYKKMDSLKVYEIATFTHFYQGKDWGKYSILWCPYNENANWDSSVKWDNVYFIIPQNVVEPVQQKN
jgi:hypothetical protein